MIHTSGYNASIFWARFPRTYIDLVRNQNIYDLKAEHTIRIYHTEPYDLLDSNQRRRFITDFVVLLCWVRDGNSSVGYLRLPGDRIHRNEDEEEQETQRSDDEL